MRNLLCLVLLVPVLALAAGKALPSSAIAPENGPTNTLSPAQTPASAHNGQPNIPCKALVGTLDTIGGTVYDWWTNGPRLREIVNSPGHGVHALWMYSDNVYGGTPPESFPDRNMRYNYYNYATHVWDYNDVDYMASGVNVFPHKAGYGAIDADSSGAAIIAAHLRQGTSSTIVPWVAKDAGPGYGLFSDADTLDLGAYQWPAFGVSGNGAIHIFPITGAYAMEYSHIMPDSWPHFSTPITDFTPNPGFISQNLAASKISGKVALAWEIQSDIPQDAYIQTSTDYGTTWTSPTTIDPPAAFGGETLTSYHFTSLFPWYDANDRLHIATLLLPTVRDTEWIIPAQIWHYCPDIDPQWSRISIATCDLANLQGSVGYNAAYACRPNIGSDDDGNLFVAWEQFDSANIEPTTTYLRADIFAARSTDNGITWGDPLKLTDAGSYSMRFPSVIDRAVEGAADGDTMYVLYEQDSVAGFIVQSQGAVSRNPVVVQKVPIGAIPAAPYGVAEQRTAASLRLDATPRPNPFEGRTVISYSLPRTGDASLVVYDAAGRPVQTLASGRQGPGRYTATWDAKKAAAGVYFCTLTNGKASLTKKLILTR